MFNDPWNEPEYHGPSNYQESSALEQAIAAVLGLLGGALLWFILIGKFVELFQ